MLSDTIGSTEDLERRLSEPTESDRSFVRSLRGDLIILGAGGKMGPSLAKLAKRAADEVGIPKRIIAVSRFTSEAAQCDLERAGIEVVSCDLLNPAEVNQLPP